MPRTKKPELLRADFARHEPRMCSFCDAGAPALCNAFQMFVHSGGTRESWNVLRSFMVPKTGRYLGATVWQLVCKAEGITDFTGGRYRDGGDIPTPQLVVFAITSAGIIDEED